MALSKLLMAPRSLAVQLAGQLGDGPSLGLRFAKIHSTIFSS
jgi:hypothetical protein